MNIPRHHVELLMEFGYTETEAQFLYVVATHSGYFTLKQYPTFADAHPGKRSSLFAQKILNNGHASVSDYMGCGSIYHLFSRTLYHQIEKESLRIRCAHSFEFIRTWLVQLDFILANREAEYLETEPDKVNFFCEKLDIAKEFLPGKVYEGGPGSRPTIRHFVDKFPLFLAPPLPGTPPVVTLSYIDCRLGTISVFLTHLAAYQSLFRQLHSFRLLCISPGKTGFPRVAECFRHAVKKPLEPDVSGEIIRYSQVRKRFESRQYIVPVTEDFEFLNEAKRRFHGERFENLYQSSDSGRLSEPELRRALCQLQPDRKVFFETYLMGQHRLHLEDIGREQVNVA